MPAAPAAIASLAGVVFIWFFYFTNRTLFDSILGSTGRSSSSAWW